MQRILPFYRDISFDTFDGAKPQFLDLGLRAPLSINPERTPGFRPGSRRVDVKGETSTMRMSMLLIGAALLSASFALDVQAQEAGRPGLNTTLRTFEEEVKSIQELGVRTIRVPLQWQFVKIRPGEYDWSTIDRFVRTAQAKQIEVLFNIRTTFRGQKETPKSRRKKGVIQTPQIDRPTVDAKEWVHFIGALASRYRGQGVNYEIENEVNSHVFWRGTLEEYLELLKEGYDVIKKADPQAKVLPSAMECGITRNFQSGSASGGDWKWHDSWLQSILSAKKFDAVSVHNYYFPSDIVANGLTFHSYLEHIHELVRKSGGGECPIWITEAGFVSAPAEIGGRTDTGSYEKQAKWLTEAYQQAHEFGVERIYWLLLRDGKEAYFGSMGLADMKDVPRPAWNALKQFAQGKEEKK